VPGVEELRSAVAATYEAVDAADVLTFAGAEEALFRAPDEVGLRSPPLNS
jgi:aspartate/methionine/tyrosine aminotransferase